MERALLSLEILPELIPGTSDQKLRVQLIGDPVLIAKAIRAAMDARQDICAAYLAGVIDWCIANNIDCGNLRKMIKFH